MNADSRSVSWAWPFDSSYFFWRRSVMEQTSSTERRSMTIPRCLSAKIFWSTIKAEYIVPAFGFFRFHTYRHGVVADFRLHFLLGELALGVGDRDSVEFGEFDLADVVLQFKRVGHALHRVGELRNGAEFLKNRHPAIPLRRESCDQDANSCPDASVQTPLSPQLLASIKDTFWQRKRSRTPYSVALIPPRIPDTCG